MRFEILIILAIAVIGLPFYIYILSKCATLGKLIAIKQFTKKESEHGKKHQEEE